jgi:hypothetical protein
MCDCDDYDYYDYYDDYAFGRSELREEIIEDIEYLKNKFLLGEKELTALEVFDEIIRIVR